MSEGEILPIDICDALTTLPEEIQQQVLDVAKERALQRQQRAEEESEARHRALYAAFLDEYESPEA